MPTTVIDRNYISQTGDIPSGMQLINDAMPLVVKEQKVITESQGGPSIMRITGIFQRADKTNENGRIYPRNVLKEAVDSIQDDLKARRVMGECDHPLDSKLHIDRVSHLVTRIWMEGDIVYGEAEIIDKMPCGSMLKALFEHKVQVGISSRGIGDMQVDEDESGNEIYKVQDGYRFITWDAVSQPSVPGGYLSIMESRQRIKKAANEAKVTKEKELLEEIKKHIRG